MELATAVEQLKQAQVSEYLRPYLDVVLQAVECLVPKAQGDDGEIMPSTPLPGRWQAFIRGIPSDIVGSMVERDGKVWIDTGFKLWRGGKNSGCTLRRVDR
jgi:hypothetical protein